MSKKTLVLGASLKADRYSNIAVNRLRQKNHDVVAFGLKQGEVKDVVIDTNLKAYEDLDTITLYLNPKHQEAYYDYILDLRPKRVIFNPGTENPELYKILRANNIEFEVACTLVLLATNQY
ncbi:CoA-binding protein [Winogradskyella algicola]|uniref:CoA-binding protein n=1 Tax=Winogradskyella algicola TaxID=2575815 RepID=UPI0011093B82|nr:CoA-binding protein [Winogradskyella algicola]